MRWPGTRSVMAKFRLLSLSVTVIMSILILGGYSLAQSDRSDTLSSNNSASIVASLFPDGVADAKQLSHLRRDVAVRALESEQARATGPRASGITYLLAVLRHHYSVNRRKLVTTLQGCTHRPVIPGCDEDTAGYVIDLFDRGDRTLLPLLIDIGPHSDGALAEEMGPFYGETLWKQPRLFLLALARLAPKGQREVCWLAATGDGSGMSSEKMEHDIRHNLRRFSEGRGDRLASVARKCLGGFEAGVKAVNEGNAAADVK